MPYGLKPKLPLFRWFLQLHELTDGVRDDLKLSIVFFSKAQTTQTLYLRHFSTS